MLITAKTKSVKQSARKVRLSADLVRGLKVNDALNQLRVSKKESSLPVSKTILSAIANAEHNYNLDKNNLFIKEIKVDDGVVLKRWMPRAFGRATPIRKKMSHITLILGEIKDSGEVQPRKQKLDKPIKLSQKPTEENNEEVSEETETDTKKKISDPSKEGKRSHSKIEGGSNKGFVTKIFQRKAG